MNAPHVTGGTIGVALGALAVGLLKHYGVTTFSDADAALIGGAAGGLGVGVAHGLWNVGVAPIVSRLIHGPAKPAPPVIVPPTPPAS